MGRLSNASIRDQEAILLALAAPHPEGLSSRAIGRLYRERTGSGLADRTLARRLSRLVADGRLVVVGDGRTTRYRVPAPSVASPSQVQEPTGTRETPPGDEPYPPLSPDGRAARDLVRRPLMVRAPVGYEFSWLESYRPGVDWLLPAGVREALHELGRVPGGQRPAGTYARDILGRLLVDLSWASSRLEGNTYDRLDTQNLIEFGQRAEGTDAREAQMILNHKRAIEYLVEDAEHIGFDASTIRTLHAALSENLLADPADEGRLRQRAVDITGTTYTPTAIPQVVDEAFRTLLARASAIPDPYEQAFFAMVHLPYLQPFVDVNKRTSRLAANIPLIASNLAPLSFVDVPERAYVEGTIAVYEMRRVDLLRDVFVWAYERSCARYRVVRDSAPPPDPIRLTYREALSAVIREVVIGGHAPARSWLRDWAQAHDIPARDVEAFAERALAGLLGLNEASAARARLRPSEYAAWRARFAG